MKKNYVLFVTITVFLALLFLLLLQIPNSKQKVIKFGYLPISGSLALFIAQDKGLFQKYGLKVNLIKFESSNPLAESLVSGSIDAEIGTSSFVMATLASKAPNKVKVIQFNVYDGNKYVITSILSKKSSTISKVTDLKGKTIACFPGVTNKTLTRIYLQRNNAYDDKTNIVEMAAGLQLAALESGTIDAVSIYEPYGTIGRLSSNTKLIAYAPVEREVLSPWVAGTTSLNYAFIQERYSEATAIKKALYEAAEFMRTNPNEAKKYLIKYTPITDTKILEKLPLPNTFQASKVKESDFQKMVNLFYNEKLLEKKVTFKQIIW